MMPVFKCRVVIDMAMTILLPLLMGYALMGEGPHKVLGAAFFLLFAVHNLLNWRWYGNLLKGVYTPRRFFHTVVTLLSCAAVFSLMVSADKLAGGPLSRLELPIVSMLLARRTHLSASYWAFVLMSLHLGMHWNMASGVACRLQSVASSKRSNVLTRLLIAVFCLFGARAVINQGIANYLFLFNEFLFFDYTNAVVFFFDYVAMMAFFCTVGYGLTRLPDKIGRNQV